MFTLSKSLEPQPARKTAVREGGHSGNAHRPRAPDLLEQFQEPWKPLFRPPLRPAKKWSGLSIPPDDEPL